MIVLALTLNGPLVILMGIMIALVAGAAGGFVFGTQMGKTRPETPLPTTARLTRDILAQTGSDLEKASRKLTDAHRPELAGSARVLARRIEELSGAVGRVGRKVQHQEGNA